MTAETPWTVGALWASAGVVLSWLLSAATGGWRARGIIADMDEKIAKQATDTKKELREEHDAMSREFGETVAAVREKFNETDRDMKKFELWTRDNLVSKPDFKDTIAGINRTFESLAVEMRMGFRDLGNKIDKMHGRE